MSVSLSPIYIYILDRKGERVREQSYTWGILVILLFFIVLLFFIFILFYIFTTTVVYTFIAPPREKQEETTGILSSLFISPVLNTYVFTVKMLLPSDSAGSLSFIHICAIAWTTYVLLSGRSTSQANISKLKSDGLRRFALFLHLYIRLRIRLFFFLFFWITNRRKRASRAPSLSLFPS